MAPSEIDTDVVRAQAKMRSSTYIISTADNFTGERK